MECFAIDLLENTETEFSFSIGSDHSMIDSDATVSESLVLD
jgi:hypothetical protein